MCWIIKYFACLLLINAASGFTDNQLNAVEKLATEFGKAIRQIFFDATAFDEIEKKFQAANRTIRIKDGDSMIREFASNVTDMLSQKHHAVQRLVSVAEKSNSAHEYNESIALDYPRAKHLTPDFILTPNERFDSLPVNTSLSSVHIPTDIYDQSVEILNGVLWSNALDEVFKQNLESDATIGWQYFSSSAGFFRIFPGIVWSIPSDANGVDFFDSRTRPWYIQAATSPKDVVILVDSSGSMTGQKMKIAKMAVTAVLNTLSDDDFFNVIVYSDHASYVDDCFNRTLLQANGDNKQRIKKSLLATKTKGIAFLEYGLIEAFSLLHRSDESGAGALCNKAIIVISDEITKTYEEIFIQYNQPITDVRIFIYLIGREVVDINPSRFIVCTNKGYLSNIATSADVTENVQRYVKVMARPMVLSKPTVAVWTSAYLASNDAVDQELQLMTTLSQPVFDTRPEYNTSGNLLGVIGTDVPVGAITSLIPPYKLGVNGYSFAITNNGYIILHPDFRPLDNGKPKPSYNSVLLTEVEISDNATELEVRMVNRETGNLTMLTTIHYDQIRRIAVRSNNYYFAPISGTPFSLGIVLPDGYGFTQLDGKVHLESADLSVLDKGNIIIASWNYCSNMKGNRTDSRLDVLKRILRRNPNRSSIRELCDVELIEHLLFDAEMTKDVEQWWRINVNSKKLSESVLSVFVGTQSGLTRYWKQGNRTTDFPPAKTTSLTEMYYTMAVDNGRDIVSVSSPLNPVSPGYQVTMSCPVVVAEDNLTAVAAVVGMQLKYEFLKSLFKRSVSIPCDGRNETNCSFSCNANAVDCYLLDANGYVLLSNSDNEVGRFFGEIDATVMNRLHDEKDNPQRIYKSVVFYDYQDVCLLYDEESSSSPSSTNIGLLSQLLDFLICRISIVIQSIFQLTLSDWSVKSVLSFLLRPPLYTEAAADERSSEPFMCDRALNLFFAPRLWNTTAPSGKAEINNCPGNCKKSLAFSHVPLTNLFLVVSDSKCSCTKDAPILRERQATTYNDSTICEKLREISHRMRPEYCFSSHPMEKQGSCEASGDSCPSKILLTFLSAILLFRPLN